jgi:hypothetical protein
MSVEDVVMAVEGRSKVLAHYPVAVDIDVDSIRDCISLYLRSEFNRESSRSRLEASNLAAASSDSRNSQLRRIG